MWADVAAEGLERARVHERALEEWAPCGTPAACLLVVPGCRMLPSLAMTKGALALWAGKEAELPGILEGGIPKPFL